MRSYGPGFSGRQPAVTGMRGLHGYEIWLPLGLTVAIWMVAIFGIAAFVSKTWADLFGLFFLLASPVVYRSFKSLVGEERGRGGNRVDTAFDNTVQ